MTEQSQLKWRCRRGIKELDLVLEHYLEAHYEHSNAEMKNTFKALLDYEDPELMALITGDKSADTPKQEILLEKLKAL